MFQFYGLFVFQSCFLASWSGPCMCIGTRNKLKISRGRLYIVVGLLVSTCLYRFCYPTRLYWNQGMYMHADNVPCKSFEGSGCITMDSHHYADPRIAIATPRCAKLHVWSKITALYSSLWYHCPDMTHCDPDQLSCMGGASSIITLVLMWSLTSCNCFCTQKFILIIYSYKELN